MSANTLPPGWSGNDASHHISVGEVIKIHVVRPSVSLNSFNAYGGLSYAKKRHRRDDYRYEILVGGVVMRAADGFNAASKARDVAWWKLRDLVAEMTQAVDHTFEVSNG